MTDENTWPADKVERRKVSELDPYVNNSRLHSESQIKQLAESIKEWGWTIPVLIDEDGTIIAGHGRIMAAKLIKIETVPCMVAAGWTEAQKRAYTIADNKLSENSEWDYGVLNLELDAIAEMDFGMDVIGFEPVDMPDFAPNTHPNIDTSDVSGSDVDKTAAGLQGQFSGADHTKGHVKVICPHCAEEFTYVGN